MKVFELLTIKLRIIIDTIVAIVAIVAIDTIVTIATIAAIDTMVIIIFIIHNKKYYTLNYGNKARTS